MAIVAKITLIVDEEDVIWCRIISFIAEVCGAWYYANIRRSGTGSPLVG